MRRGDQARVVPRPPVPPTRMMTLRSSTRSSLAWSASGISPISSRNSVPPFAASKKPTLRRSAPVNAPFSWPNSSLSSSDSGSAAQLMPRWAPRCAARALVDRFGHELLADAGLAEDQHGHRGVGDAIDERVHAPHRGIDHDGPFGDRLRRRGRTAVAAAQRCAELADQRLDRGAVLGAQHGRGGCRRAGGARKSSMRSIEAWPSVRASSGRITR